MNARDTFTEAMKAASRGQVVTYEEVWDQGMAALAETHPGCLLDPATGEVVRKELAVRSNPLFRSPTGGPMVPYDLYRLVPVEPVTEKEPLVCICETIDDHLRHGCDTEAIDVPGLRELLNTPTVLDEPE